MFARVYMGRKRRGRAPFNTSTLRAKGGGQEPLRMREGIGRTPFSAHVRWREHGAPVQNHRPWLGEEFGRLPFEPKEETADLSTTKPVLTTSLPAMRRIFRSFGRRPKSSTLGSSSAAAPHSVLVSWPHSDERLLLSKGPYNSPRWVTPRSSLSPPYLPPMGNPSSSLSPLISPRWVTIRSFLGEVSCFEA
jgi:hypothetical protein